MHLVGQLPGAITTSNVHFTSSAVTGAPSDHFARSSMMKTNSRPSSEIDQRFAIIGTKSIVSVSVDTRLSYISENIIDVYVLVSMYALRLFGG